MGRIAALWLCAALAAPGAVRAESAFDLVFRGATLDGLPAGAELRYEAEEAGARASGEAWGEVVVGVGSDGRAVVEAWGEGDPRPLGSFRASIGNPVAMVFLDQTVRDVAAATGGSPFYIRNRIREALAAPAEAVAVTVDWDGAAVTATAVMLSPFARDARRAELGPFADIEIGVVVSEAVPGWYHSIRAEAAGASFAASLTLTGVER